MGANGDAFSLKDLMQISKRDATAVRDHLRREPHVVEMRANELLAAMQVAVANGRGMARQHAVIGLDHHRQEIDEMLAHHGASCVVQIRDAFAGKPQRVDEQRADAAAGVELQRCKAFRAGDPGAQDGAWNLEHPERRRILMTEFIGQMASLDYEGAGPAPHVLAVLLKTNFGELGDGYEERFFSLVYEVP